MNNMAIVGKRATELYPHLRIQEVTLKGVAMSCGIIPTPHAQPRDDHPLAEAAVLVRVRAFSCNYRDQPLLINAYLKKPETCLWPTGSEFVAEVLRCGSAVQDLKPGDRVIPDHTYRGAFYATGPTNGVITNNASLEYQVHPACKLLKIPEALEDIKAAAFSLGSQTVYSMIRRIRVNPGDRVLVMSAASNTSLFALAALKARGIEAVIHTGSPQGQAIRGRFGALTLVTGGEGWRERLLQMAKEFRGFDAVIDPFFDIHAGTALMALKPGGRYVTCGVLKQFSHPYDYGTDQNGTTRLGQVIDAGIMNNLEIVFNCLGLREDLEQALADHLAGRYDILIDSVYGPGQEAAFLERTFEDRDRLGKVVFQY